MVSLYATITPQGPGRREVLLADLHKDHPQINRASEPNLVGDQAPCTGLSRFKSGKLVAVTTWHKENGYIRMPAIIAAYEMSRFLFKRNHEHSDSWGYIEISAELNAFQFLKVNWELRAET